MYKSPFRDREVMVVGDRVDATFIKLFYAAIKLHQVKGFFVMENSIFILYFHFCLTSIDYRGFFLTLDLGFI